jgi:hypothetical protein
MPRYHGHDVLYATAGKVVKKDLGLWAAAQELEITINAMRRIIESWREQHPEHSGREIVAQVLDRQITLERAVEILDVTPSWLGKRAGAMGAEREQPETMAKLLNGEIEPRKAARKLRYSKNKMMAVVEVWRQSHPESTSNVIGQVAAKHLDAATAAEQLGVSLRWVKEEVGKLTRERQRQYAATAIENIVNGETDLHTAATASGININELRRRVGEWRLQHPDQSGEEVIAGILESRVNRRDAARQLSVTPQWVAEKLETMLRERSQLPRHGEPRRSNSPIATKAVTNSDSGPRAAGSKIRRRR